MIMITMTVVMMLIAENTNRDIFWIFVLPSKHPRDNNMDKLIAL